MLHPLANIAFMGSLLISFLVIVDTLKGARR